jgi:predicted tellurium resistance membrane protein TerC
MLDALSLLALLMGLELILGVDNVLVIAILVERLPESMQQRARVAGLALAMVARLVMLGVVLALTGLTHPVVLSFSIRDMVLMGGGFFLLFKAVHEIHKTVELQDEVEVKAATGREGNSGFVSVIVQIALLDMVFSIDSVITALGLTSHVWIIVTAVVLSFVVILVFARPIGDFIMHNPALKILALSFLITIGVTIFLEGMHKHVPKGYIYLPMGFALGVEILQMRYARNRRTKMAARQGVAAATNEDDPLQ